MFGGRDAFFRVPRTTRETSGGPVELPILYYDASNVVAVFRASRAGAERLLEGTGYEPQLGPGGSATVALSFYEYRRTSVGVYSEVGTAVLAVPRGARQPRLGIAEMLAPARWRTAGAFVVDLPVTTPIACAAGREIWGYPKFVTDISFRLRKRDFESVVYEPGGGGLGSVATAPRIVSVSGHLGPGLPAPPLAVVTYTVLDGVQVKTYIDVRGTVSVRAPGSVTLEVGASEHRMARNLRVLGLGEGKVRPSLVIATDSFQSVLPDGVASASVSEEEGLRSQARAAAAPLEPLKSSARVSP